MPKKTRKRNSFFFSFDGSDESDDEYKLAEQGDEYSPAYSSREDSYFPPSISGVQNMNKMGIEKFVTSGEKVGALEIIA